MAPPDVLNTVAPPVSEKEATVLAHRHFGVGGRIRTLTSERDHNFHIAAADGQGYVLKMTNPAEPRPVTDFQTQALLHIADQDPSLPVPRVVRTLEGASEVVVTVDGLDMVLRLLTYLEGQPLHAAPPSPGQMRSLGTTLGRLDKALVGFEHPGARRDLLWDICRLPTIRDRLHYLTDPGQRDMVARFVDHFTDTVVPRLPGLRHQVIHNDLNPHNAVLDPNDQMTVTGIIDFGDALWGPVVNDLATALAYHVSDCDDPFGDLVEMTRAYHAVFPLTADEVAVLPDLVAGRLALTIGITSWRAAEHPSNRDYILRNFRRAFTGLTRLTGAEGHDARTLLRQACSEGTPA